MTTCPDGHDSDADDYCSVCGLAIDGSSGASLTAVPTDPAAPAAPGGLLACPNCAEPHGRDDVFCENCGYDFITGSLPQPEAPITSGAPVATTPGGAPAQVLAEVVISFDARYHEHMDADGVVTVPDPEPAPRTVSITSSPVLIGRASPSRNIYPDLDVPDDPAASSRHARLDRRPDGVWTITDLGSTNGTYVGDGFTQLEANTSHQLVADQPIYVGAWTKLTVTPS